MSACNGPATVQVAATASPTIAAKTPALSTEVSPTLDLNALTSQDTYAHPSQRFSINYPVNWETIEQPDGVIIAEPEARAGYSVLFNDAGERYSGQELSQFLVTFVGQNYAGDASNFKAIRQEQQADGSIVAQFSWLDPNLGQTISEVHVTQQDTIVFVVHLSVIENEWATVSPHLQALANTFVPLDTSSTLVPATPIPPEWILIGPDSQEFGFLYASDWDILTQGSNQITVGSPDTGLTFSASNFDWPNAASVPHAAENAALAHLEEIRVNNSDVQHLPPTPFPLDTATGSTIDFLYTSEGGQSMAGSVITAVGNGKMHKIVFTAPTEIYDAALQWFNPMYKSFKFLSPDAFISEE